MIKKPLYIALALAAALATGCDDKTEYVPGEPDAADCMGVYFDADNDADFIFALDQTPEITLTIHRERADKAADVPLKLTSTAAGITLPASVHFDQGSHDAEFTVNFAGIPTKQLTKFAIDFADEYINHYAETLFNYESTVIISEWEPANLDGSPVKFYFSESNCVYYPASTITSAVYQPVESEMEVLPGARRIRIHNFINSGIDMTFELTPSPYADFEGLYRVSPIGNMCTMAEVQEDESYGDEYYNAWYLCTEEWNEEDQEYDLDYAEAALTDLNGNPSVLSYPLFYWYSDGYVYEYSVATLKGTPGGKSDTLNAVSMGISGVVEAGSGLTLPAYFYLNFVWDGSSSL